jgi:hypothetical protein
MVRGNIHINTDSLIRHNREWLGLPAQVLAPPPFHVQNIIAWRQHSTIISVRVRSNPRDFSFFAAAQDEQWIVSVVFCRHRRRVFIPDVALPADTRKMHPIIRFLRNMAYKKMGGIEFTYPAHLRNQL